MSNNHVFQTPVHGYLRLPATALASKIRQLEIGVEELLLVFIDRIYAVNPSINAVVADRFSDALQEAKEIDEMLCEMTREERDELAVSKPFFGVPFTIKESFAVRGLPNSGGLVSRRDLVADDDAVVVRRLRLAGAIPLAVSNCSELSMWWESANKVYGRTCNPFDFSKIVGGSSGGEGAIIGAAGSVIGIGADVGGSIRMPSFFNGIFGHKPSPDIVPNSGQFPDATGNRQQFLCTGPMCRYAEDLKPLLAVMAGEGATSLNLDDTVNVSKLRIFTIEDCGGNFLVSNVAPELKQAQLYVCQQLEEKLGVKAEPLKIDKLASSLEIWTSMMSSAAQKPFCFYLGNQEASVNPYWELMKACVGLSNHTIPAIGLGILEKVESVTPKGVLESFLQIGEELRQELESILGEDGIVLYPSHPSPALNHNQPLLFPFNFSYTAIFNVLYLPVTQCPVGLSQSGLPLGVQVVAANNKDRLCLAVALEIERLCGGWDRLYSKKLNMALNLEQ